MNMGVCVHTFLIKPNLCGKFSESAFYFAYILTHKLLTSNSPYEWLQSTRNLRLYERDKRREKEEKHTSSEHYNKKFICTHNHELSFK